MFWIYQQENKIKYQGPSLCKNYKIICQVSLQIHISSIILADLIPVFLLTQILESEKPMQFLKSGREIYKENMNMCIHFQNHFLMQAV